MTSENRERLRQQLIRDEGYRRHAYLDSEGYWTIGIGRCIDARRGKGISYPEALSLLDNDLRDATSDVVAHLPWTITLDEVRRAAVIHLAFHLGIGGLLGFRRMLAAAERGDWEAAARELLDSRYHQQVGARAERLAEQLRTGEWR